MTSVKYVLLLSNKKIVWVLKKVKWFEGIKSLIVLILKIANKRNSPKKKKKHQKMNNT